MPILEDLNDVISELEDKNHIELANSLQNVFVRLAQDHGRFFDHHQRTQEKLQSEDFEDCEECKGKGFKIIDKKFQSCMDCGGNGRRRQVNHNHWAKAVTKTIRISIK